MNELTLPVMYVSITQGIIVSICINKSVNKFRFVCVVLSNFNTEKQVSGIITFVFFNCQALTSKGELIGRVEQKVDQLPLNFFF